MRPFGADFAGLVDVGNGHRLWLECRGTGSLTVVLVAGYPNRADVWDTVALDHQDDFPAGISPEVVERAWQEMQAELAGLVPGARHVIAMESGHYIQWDQPELVVEIVREVAGAVQDPTHCAMPTPSPAAAIPSP